MAAKLLRTTPTTVPAIMALNGSVRHLAHAAHDRERRAQLARGVRGEPPELVERLLEARQRRASGGRQVLA
jgi:hypothetical protein